jgi:hypothetical protein
METHEVITWQDIVLHNHETRAVNGQLLVRVLAEEHFEDIRSGL